MRGHIRQRGDRSWAVVVDLAPDPTTGKRRQKWHGVKGTKRDAERVLGELLHQLNTQQYAEPTRMTVAQYFEDWLQDKASCVRPTTWQSYAAMVRRHIVPGLGHLALSQLTPVHVQSWCREQLRWGRADGRNAPLSARTVQYAHAVLYRGLRQAVQLQLVARNVAAAAHPPRPERPDVLALDVGVAGRLLEAARDTRCHLPVMLAVTTRMRRGEVLGLRWQDVDLRRGIVGVRQCLVAVGAGHRFTVPKTAKGRRPVALPPLAVAALGEQRRRQAEFRQVLGPRALAPGGRAPLPTPFEE